MRVIYSRDMYYKQAKNGSVDAYHCLLHHGVVAFVPSVLECLVQHFNGLGPVVFGLKLLCLLQSGFRGHQCDHFVVIQRDDFGKVKFDYLIC